MNKRLDLLGELVRYIKCGKKAHNKLSKNLNKENVDLLLVKMYEYYKINDIETCGNLGDVFYALYIREINSSYDEIAAEFYIHISTLDRYRKKYNQLAESLIETLFF